MLSACSAGVSARVTLNCTPEDNANANATKNATIIIGIFLFTLLTILCSYGRVRLLSYIIYIHINIIAHCLSFFNLNAKIFLAFFKFLRLYFTFACFSLDVIKIELCLKKR